MRPTVCALALSLFAAAAFAQTTASLTGNVSTAGNALPGVTVTLASPTLQGARTTITGEGGAYNFAALPPGDYRVTFALAGMDTITTNARVHLSQTSRVDAAMRVSGEITVTATTPAPLETPEVATNFTLAEIERLPVQRNQLATAQLASGVTANVLQNGQLQISGAPGYDNLVLVNGVVVNENVRGQNRPMYVEDAILETTVMTGAISAEYGRFTGGVVNTVTRFGGNELSGSVRDSLSSPRWSAQTPIGETRASTLNHVWEATLGGYALRDRLWFFAAGRRAKNDTARTTIPVPAFAGPASPTPQSQQISYTESNDQKRFEAKLTGQIDARQSLVGAWFGIDTKTKNSRFNNNVYDLASLTRRDEPESLISLHYNGVISRELLAEVQFAKRKMSFRGNGAQVTDIIGGTLVLDRANSNARFNSPTLCGVCAIEHRDNDDVLAKASYFLDTTAFGTHNLVAGVDRFEERRAPNNFQSGSAFSLFVTRAQFKDGAIFPVINPTTAQGGNTFIRWSPVFDAVEENELRTDSVFVNDKWDISARWNVSAGLRYDKNHAVDANGTLASDDAKLAPRFGVHFDPRGNGRQRISASFAEYSSRVADRIASAGQSAGEAAAIDFAYKGPAINAGQLTVALPDAIRMVFDYFNNTQGGTANRAESNLRANGSRTIPGYAVYFDGTLKSPSVREASLGYGAQLGANGFAKVDLIARDWRDFYAAMVTTATRRETTPLGIPVDLALYRNSDNVERTYRAVQLQARWNPPHVQTGLNYTWSKLRGNDEGEVMAGPTPNLDPAIYYPEFMDYAQFNPIGYLQGDQRHRLRAWAGYEIGDFNFSLLQTYDSGQPYSAVAQIATRNAPGAPANPGYASVPTGTYFFSDRGAFRTDDITSTNLALRYARRIMGLELFAQGDLLNVLNEDGIADPVRINTTVTVLQAFNPRTTQPVAGTHYNLSPQFGQALNDQAYQQPRTYRVSVGLRF